MVVPNLFSLPVIGNYTHALLVAHYKMKGGGAKGDFYSVYVEEPPPLSCPNNYP